VNLRPAEFVRGAEGHVGELHVDDRLARSGPDLRYLGRLEHLRGPELPHYHGPHARWTGLAGYVRACVELRSGALASLAGQIETTAEMRGTARRNMARTAEIVDRAHRDGSLRADVTALDIAWLIEQFSRRAPDPVDPDEERNVRARLVAIALDGLRARSGQARETLPGRPPSRARYVNRWSYRPPAERPQDP
jgi:hypothetical protein